MRGCMWVVVTRVVLLLFCICPPSCCHITSFLHRLVGSGAPEAGKAVGRPRDEERARVESSLRAWTDMREARQVLCSMVRDKKSREEDYKRLAQLSARVKRVLRL